MPVNMPTAKWRAMNQMPFKGYSTLGVKYPYYYVVYSYGFHAPIYVYAFAESSWYGNKTDYSLTTKKHKKGLKPVEDSQILWLDEQQIQNILTGINDD